MNYDTIRDWHPIDLLPLDTHVLTIPFIRFMTVKVMIFDDEARPVLTIPHVLLALYAVCLSIPINSLSIFSLTSLPSNPIAFPMPASLLLSAF